MAELINSQSSAIERRLARSLSSTRILAQEVRQHGGLFEKFEDYADEVIQSIGGVSNLQLAPDGIIHSIHPLAGNEKAIGHNILKDDRRRKEALMALREENMTLAGPFELIQGGIAIIGRNPVFLTDPDTNKKRFWGFASALIYLNDLLSVTDLNELAEKGYAYELSRMHPDTGKFDIFAYSEEPVQERSVKAEIIVPNGQWILKMSAPLSVPPLWFYVGYSISVLFGAVIVLLLRKVLIQPEILQKVVDQQTRELQHLAHHDPLTGLPNRIKLQDAVERALLGHARYNISAVLLMIDLDDFKQINDLCGHDEGDCVLKVVAERLRGSTRSVDTVARMGGDEFAVLLQHTDSIADVSQSIQHILAAIKQPILLDKQSFTVSASIGIALVSKDGSDYMSVYKHADMAMYAAKDTGKNKFCFYNNALQEQAVKRIETQNELILATEREEFELYLQPIISLSDQELQGYEALIRWNHPQRGVLGPNEFIEIAESTNTIFELGYWAFSEACRLIYSYQLPVLVSVNLSPKQFRDPKLADKLKEALLRYPVSPGQLELELTESCFIDDIDGAIKTMESLGEMGLSLSLDDFGTGYSSLTLLQRLPVHKLKIDRSFISDLTEGERDKDIVQGLNVMAQKLGLLVVAEGIETAEQLAILQEMGCDLGQGYYYNKPLPIKVIYEGGFDPII